MTKLTEMIQFVLYCILIAIPALSGGIPLDLINLEPEYLKYSVKLKSPLVLTSCKKSAFLHKANKYMI